jgi:hypothetical protein
MKSETPHFVDHIIIGGGLSGLLIAKGLQQQGKSFLILEASDRLGGISIDGGLRLIYQSQLCSPALRFLNQVSGLSFSAEVTTDVTTIESKQWIPFVGFGEEAPPYADLILPYAKGFLSSTLGLETWLKQLAQEMSAVTSFNSKVIKFHESNNKIEKLELSNKKLYQAQSYFFCLPATEVKKLIPQAKISNKSTLRFLKGPFWTQIGIELWHESFPSEFPQNKLFVLNSTLKNESQAGLGIFYEAHGEKRSQWVTFCNDDSVEDAEGLGKSVQNFKRLIKKFMPATFEGLQRERLVIAPTTYKDSDWHLEPNGTYPELENLWVASGIANKQSGLLGSLLQAQFILAAVQNTASASLEPSPSQTSDLAGTQ